MPAPLISVIVVNWNGLGLLDECFESLARQTWPETEFILVDNGSTDGSRDLVTAWAKRLPNAQAILLPTNTGFWWGEHSSFCGRRREGRYSSSSSASEADGETGAAAQKSST